MATVFTKIISGELPSYKVFETENVYAFLALDQINLGHTLVIPKKEVNHFFDMDQKDYDDVFKVSKILSETIKEVSECKRVIMAIQGFEVPHAHVHLIPANGPEEFSFSLGRKREGSEMIGIQEKLIENLKKREIL